jgi:hypothetical protein
VDSDGDFVVVWESMGSSGTDTHQSSIHGQRYASNGTAQGAEFQVNTNTTAQQIRPSIAAAANGDFVVVWRKSSGCVGGECIQGQRFASGGPAKGIEFQVNTYTTGSSFDPEVAAEAGGDFVVAWVQSASPGTDTSPNGIQAQRLSVATPVPAMSASFKVALGAVILLLGAASMRVHRRVI